MSKAPPAPLIAVDVGNAAIHVGLFAAAAEAELPRPSRRVQLDADKADPDRLADWVPEPSAAWYVASVNRPADRRLGRWVRRRLPRSSFCLLRYTDVPLPIDVDYPDRVGMDRLVAAVAADRLRRPDRPAIVVDAGTAITVDLVSADGAFRGGAILPGMKMTARALAAGTDQLPPVPPDADRPPEPVGKSTEGAIRSGLYWGTVGALRELIDRVAAKTSGKPHLFFTGGDALKLAPQVSRRVEQVPHLVLAGIALVAEHVRRKRS